MDTQIIPIPTYITNIPVFNNLDIKRATILSTMFTWEKIMANQTLFEEGTPGNAFYIVARGCVAVEVTVRNKENKGQDDQQVQVFDRQDDDEDDEESSNEFNIHTIGIGGIGVEIINPGMYLCRILLQATESQPFLCLFLFFLVTAVSGQDTVCEIIENDR